MTILIKLFLLLVIMPLAIGVLCNYLTNSEYTNLVSSVALIISIAGCLIVLYVNKQKYHSVFWNFLSVIALIFLLGYFLLGISISHIGF